MESNGKSGESVNLGTEEIRHESIEKKPDLVGSTLDKLEERLDWNWTRDQECVQHGGYHTSAGEDALKCYIMVYDDISISDRLSTIEQSNIRPTIVGPTTGELSRCYPSPAIF